MADQPDGTSQPHAARPRSPSVIVGLGASAGGIKALQEFFGQVPTDSDAAFVVILHLSPDFESRLAEVLQATTKVPVTQVRDRAPIEPNHVYVIPPNKSLSVEDGHLVLSEYSRVEHRRAPVDFFLRTLADTQGAGAACVILSGTGSDGSSGLRRVKEHGGLTIAQDPGEAEHGEMPARAIGTGFVDYVLPAAQMPGTILSYFNRLRERNEDTPAPTPDPTNSEAVREVLRLVRVRTGHDFSNYKPATVLRRIGRRVTVRAVPGFSEYAALLREQPDEAVALMKELLISVTNFFRDPDAFAALEQRVIPRLFERQSTTDQVRVWSAGCATGEEAYSLAILLAEYASNSLAPPAIQVFATDLDEFAITVAREGFYTEADVADLSEARLRRFFQRETGGYRVRRELRELVLFAHHNVIKDPPFSHLDLITCRNLLIYLNRSVQDRLLETFHFALRPGGFLFVGSSETADGGTLFIPFDKTAHLYEAGGVSGRVGVAVSDAIVKTVPTPPRLPDARPTGRLAPAELHQRLLEQYAPPSIVVTEDHTIVHVSEHAGQYLEVTGGEPSRDLLRLARRELRMDLRTGLHRAARERTAIEIGGVRLASGQEEVTLTITVRPALRQGDPARGLFLVLFQEAARAPRPEPPRITLASGADAGENHLEDELSRTKLQLTATVEQYETQVEEAKASNEELQALNEELRSAAEELETSKEELQSVNEELTTVNQELKVKIDELASTNDDFRNLINSTDIGTVFLDRSLRVKFSTRRAQDLFNLLPTDVGRRLSDITTTLQYDRLTEDVNHVLERLQTLEREVATREGRWYLMRILPYRTMEDRIDGAVLTFLDITSRREAERRIKIGEERLRLLIDSAVDYAIFTMTPAGFIDSWNVGAQRMFGYGADETIGRHTAILFTPEDRAAGVPDEELAAAARDGRAADERFHQRRDGSRFYCSGITTRLGEGAGIGFAKIARDLTPQRNASDAVRQANANLEERVEQRTRELQEEVRQRTAAQEHALTLLRKLVTAQEDQRARIARDLHDQLGQQLTALRLALERHIERVGNEHAIDEHLQRAVALTRDLDAEVDFLAWELRPAVLDDLGLAAALPRFLRQWSEHYGIGAEFRVAGFETGQLSRESEVTFYRIAQEALNNVAKHAHASRVDVILESRDGNVVLVIEDDGVGFDPANHDVTARGIGLIGMQERAALSGARLQVEATPGEGTTIFVRATVEAMAPPPRESAS